MPMATRRLPPPSRARGLRAHRPYGFRPCGGERAWPEPVGALAPGDEPRGIRRKKLFTRAHQAMKLTDDGRAFYEAVNPHLEALAVAIEGQSENIQLLRLHLGVSPLFGSQRLFPHLPALRKLHPRLHIDIDTGPNLIPRIGDTLDAAIIVTAEPDEGFYRCGSTITACTRSAARSSPTRSASAPRPKCSRSRPFLFTATCPRASRRGRMRSASRNSSPRRSTISIRAS